MELSGNFMNTINNSGWITNYRDMKKKFRQNYDDDTYYFMALNVLLSMFKYDEKVYEPELFDSILHETGCCALVNTELSKYTPAFCNFVGGDRYPDGFFKDAFVLLLDGTSRTYKDWRENKEIFVFFNNLTKTCDTFIEKYAYLLTNCDTSLDCNILFSRKKPIPIVKDNKTKNQIDKIFADLDKGEFKTIVTDVKVSDLINENTQPISVLNLSEVESSRYIQYLSQLHDNLISRLFFHMGLSMSDTSKQAQVTQAELNKNKATALAFLEGWKTPRKFGFDEIERKTGEKLFFDFSPIWKVEMSNQLYSEREKDASQLADSENESDASQLAESEVSDNENG